MIYEAGCAFPPICLDVAAALKNDLGWSPWAVGSIVDHRVRLGWLEGG